MTQPQSNASSSIRQSSHPPTEGPFLRIDEVSRRTNLTKRTLRYYEELELLDPAQRSEGNYRLYSEQDVRTVERIKAMRDLLGLPLKTIRDMVAAELERERIRDQWQNDPDLTWRLQALDDVEGVARHELKLLEEKLSGLEKLRKTILERLERYHELRAEIREQVKAMEAAQHQAQSASQQSDTTAP